MVPEMTGIGKEGPQDETPGGNTGGAQDRKLILAGNQLLHLTSLRKKWYDKRQKTEKAFPHKRVEVLVMTNFILFINSFLSYLLVFVLIAVLVVIACILGTKWRKSSDLKKSGGAEPPIMPDTVKTGK